MSNEKKFEYSKVIDALLVLHKHEASLLTLATSLRVFERLLPQATTLFQTGNEFPDVVGWGDNIIVEGFEAMATFCRRHREQFLAEHQRKQN